MSTHSFRRLVWSLPLVAACSGAPSPQPAEPGPAPAPVAAAPTAEPEPTQPTAKPAETAVSETSPPPAPAGPKKSAYTIGGVSLSEVDMKTVRAALQKAGYDFIGPTDSTVCGSIEIFQLGLARQGKSVGVFNLQRQAKAASTGCVPTSLKETFDSWKATKVSAGKAAMIFDEQGDVLCSVLILKDKNGAAKTLLDNLVVSP